MPVPCLFMFVNMLSVGQCIYIYKKRFCELKIVFVSNYFNHHQEELSENLYKKTNGDYRFVSTTTMRDERKALGYGTKKDPEYVLHAYLDESECEEAKKWIVEADAVIVGSAPEKIIQYRCKNGKLVFKYSERPLKNGMELYKYVYRWFKWHLNGFSNSNCYLLSASAYAVADYAKFGLFKNKCFKFGYFPRTNKYADVKDLITHKKTNSILWVGRFLDWKHPDAVIEVARKLKHDNYQFVLNIIGTGNMEAEMRKMIDDYNLSDCVSVLGSMSPNKVRDYMEKSSIFLFTSDRNEGWGAVLNEAMNSGCAVVASHAIGSVPFLVKDGENGLIYESNNTDMLCSKVKYLLDDSNLAANFGKNAYNTVVTYWNSEKACERLISIIEHILLGEKTLDMYENGPCSKAIIIQDSWRWQRK